jgi:hypothetical protein
MRYYAKSKKRAILRIYDWIRFFKEVFSKRKSFGLNGFRQFFDKELSLKLVTLQEQILAQQFLTQLSDCFNPKDEYVLKYAGPPNDGGYFFLDLFQKPILISGGAGKNIDFERYFSKRGSRVLLFDGTIDYTAHNWGEIEFYNQNLGHRDQPGLCSLAKLLFEKAFDSAVSDRKSGLMLKLDIEGCEYEVLTDLKGNLSNFDQLIVEFHDIYKVGFVEFRSKFAEIVNELKSDFVSISFRSNNWDTFINYGKTFAPNTFEVTLLNKKHFSKLKILDGRVPEHKNNVNRLSLPNRIFEKKDRSFEL